MFANLLVKTKPNFSLGDSFLLTNFAILFGGLAHLARALAWHARGGRFESDILHLL